MKHLATVVILSSISSVSFGASVPLGYTSCNNGGEHAFGLTSATSCLGFGSGNINGTATDPFLTSAAGTGYSFVSKTDDSSKWTEVSSTSTSKAYTFSIDSALWNLYSDLAIAVKVGNNLQTSWAVWSAVSMSTDFKTYIAPKQGAELSHFNIYGSGTPDVVTPVPLPAAAWLFLSGLAAYAGFQAKKKNAAR